MLTQQQIEAAQACYDRIKETGDWQYWDRMPLINLPQDQQGGSGRYENQAFPYFTLENGEITASSIILGDEDDPWTTDKDREHATAFAQELLNAIKR